VRTRQRTCLASTTQPITLARAKGYQCLALCSLTPVERETASFSGFEVKHTLPPVGNKSGGMTMSATNSAVAASVRREGARRRCPVSSRCGRLRRAAQRVDTLQQCVDEVPTGER
jgi:acyl-coenzyme A thioesterase PaaI-like protein